jgi:hypothetical protein
MTSLWLSCALWVATELIVHHYGITVLPIWRGGATATSSIIGISQACGYKTSYNRSVIPVLCYPLGAHSLLSTCGLCKFVPSTSHLYKEMQSITHTITRSRELREGPVVERGTKCRGTIIHMCYSNLTLSCVPRHQFCATDGVVHRTSGAAVAWLTKNTNSYHRLGLLSE